MLKYDYSHMTMVIIMVSRIQEMAAGEFKAKCLQLMDEVEKSKKEIVITKYGKPVAKLVPYTEERKPLYGSLKGSITYIGDIISPVGEDDWEAND